MPEERELPSTYSITPPQPRIITARGMGIALYIALAAGLGLITLFMPPLIIVGAVLAVAIGILIALYPYFGLVIYYLVLVVRPEILWPQLAALRPTRMISLVLLVSMLIHMKYKGQPFVVFKDRMTKHMVFFIAALFISVPMAFWQDQSFWFSIDFLWLFLYFIILINILSTEMRIKGFLWLFLLAGGYNAISSAIAYFSGNLVVAQGIERAEGLAGADPNTLAVSIVLGLPFMYFALIWVKNKFLKILPLIFLAASIFTISITGSRSGIIGIVVSAAMIWLVSKKKMVTAMVAILVMVIGWFALPAQYQQRYASIFSDEIDPSSQGRIDAWKAGWGMFKANPITGIGVDCFPLAYASGRYSDTRVLLRPHNLYIQIISELGIVGVAAFGALIYYIMRSNFRLRKRFKSAGKADHPFVWISYSITCSFGALFATSFFGHSLFRGHWYVCAALTAALIAVSNKLLDAPKSVNADGTEERRKYRRTIPQRDKPAN